MVVSILVYNVIDDLTAPIIAKIDVDIRHTDALGIEEYLKQQAKAYRVNIRNAQAIRHKATRAGAAARSNGYIARLGIIHIVLHYKKVIRVSHIFYHG